MPREEERKITEMPSRHDHLERMTAGELLRAIHREDCGVARAVGRALPRIEALTEAVERRMREGGRLFYIGAGTSGRLGVLDASELPTTFGVDERLVTGVIAGGDAALRLAAEGAEDDPRQGWLDLLERGAAPGDSLIGVSASGSTPYVVGAVREARRAGMATGCITGNPGSPLAGAAEWPVEIVVGPEVVTGSSRMKSGTAQKMALNMISTTLMARLGRVSGNRMVNMRLSNRKLVERGTRMVAEATGLPQEEARALLLSAGSAEKAIRERCT